MSVFPEKRIHKKQLFSELAKNKTGLQPGKAGKNR
jgi:hypothetical protein